MAAPSSGSEAPAAGQPNRRKKDDLTIIKKYANRRLYNTATSMYVTLDDLYDLVREGSEFQVVDARTGEDLTHSVLVQIIFDRESKGENAMLPADFLKKLICMYDDSIRHMFPHYLNASMQIFAKQQERWQEMLGKNPVTGKITSNFNESLKDLANFNPIEAFEEIAQKNMDIFRQSMDMMMGGFTRDKEGDSKK